MSRIGNQLAKIPPFQRLLYLLVAVAILTTHAAPGSWNAASRMATPFVGAIDPWSHRDLSEVPFVANLKEIPIGVRALRSLTVPAAPSSCQTCTTNPPH